MKQQILAVAVTALLGMESVNAAALPVAPTDEVQKIQQSPCPIEGGDMTWLERFACAHDAEPATGQSGTPSLTKRNDPPAAASSDVAVKFFDELDAVFVKYENLVGLNGETTTAHPQADGQQLHTRDIFGSIGNFVKDATNKVKQRVTDIAKALVPEVANVPRIMPVLSSIPNS